MDIIAFIYRLNSAEPINTEIFSRYKLYIVKIVCREKGSCNKNVNSNLYIPSNTLSLTLNRRNTILAAVAMYSLSNYLNCLIPACLLFFGYSILEGHEHLPVTHNFYSTSDHDGPLLKIKVIDRSNGELLPARVSFQLDGIDYVPEYVNEHGIRFTSIHKSKQQSFHVLYFLNTGILEIGIPDSAKTVSVTAVHGFEYLPQTVEKSLTSDSMLVELNLERWSDLSETGWIAIDEHLHFDRLDPEDDRLWLAMLEADGLNTGHFMVLKGGMTPGLWSRQYAFGKDGHVYNESQSLVPGQEYRDSAQGHINLLGLNRPIEPYSTGGMGWPAIVENYPPLHDVFSEAKKRCGLVGVAHGGSLGKQATAVADAILGQVDFWEISNGFIYQTDTWYRLMNCGYFFAPMAGTDLPNSPFRDPWQPFLGSIRTYVHSEGKTDFESFKSSIGRGRVFISGGPLIDLDVDGKTVGDTLEISRPGIVPVKARISSPRPLREFDLVLNGISLNGDIKKTFEAGIHKWVIEEEIEIEKSGWIAAWGKGVHIQTQKIDAMAHTNAIRVIVDGKPIRSESDQAYFDKQLRERREFYREEGAYKHDAQRDRAVSLFDQAIEELSKR